MTAVQAPPRAPENLAPRRDLTQPAPEELGAGLEDVR